MIFAGTKGCGVLYSENNGTSWSTKNSGLYLSDVWALATSGNNIFAGTKNSGVFISTDFGNSWAQKGNNSFSTVYTIAIKSNDIFVGTSHGIYFSPDNGNNWIYKDIGLRYNAIIYSIVISGDNIIASTSDSGIFLSTDYGNT